jgi:hypothetical protein
VDDCDEKNVTWRPGSAGDSDCFDASAAEHVAAVNAARFRRLRQLMLLGSWRGRNHCSSTARRDLRQYKGNYEHGLRLILTF